MWLPALLLLAMPRFFLVPIDDSGLRVEDLLLLGLVVPAAVMLARDWARLRWVVAAFALYHLVVLMSVLRAAVGGQMPFAMSLAFGLRPALYAAAIVVGHRLGLRGDGVQLVRVALVAVGLHLLYGLGAVSGLLPNAASFHPSRLSGLTNGPYEMSAMACLLCVVFVACRRWVGAGAGIVALLWTQSRVALVGLLIQLAWGTLKIRVRTRLLMLLIGALLVALVVGSRDSEGASLADTLGIMSDLGEVFSQVATSREDYFDTAYSDSANGEISSLEGDPSALLRVARWAMVLTTAMADPLNLMLGMGPGFYSVALDGNYVRLLGETGVAGLVTFFLLGLAVARAVPAGWHRRLVIGLLIQLAIIAVFIDVFVALKPMCLFWMLLGAVLRDAEDAASPPAVTDGPETPDQAGVPAASLQTSSSA